MELIANQGSHVAVRTGCIYLLVQIDGVWKLANRLGQLYTPRGRFNFVRKGGKWLVSKRGEHVHISGGSPVEYAGQVRFGYNKDRGKLKSWSNASGHYLPEARLAHQAALPTALFEPFDRA